MHSRIRHPESPARAAGGFTLIELMITLSVLAVVMVVLMTVMFAAQRSKTQTSNNIEASQAARVALDMLSRDLRSAGFGADLYYLAQPQPPIAYIDSMQVLLCANFNPAPDDTVPLPPHAYSPTSWPRPYPLEATAWQPPIKYRRGAELIRWTLDVNNDGAVSAADVAHFNGVDAQRTPNPNDYVLVRQIFGDSTGNVTGSNGGQTERVALVRRPGGAVPPMFHVYLQGQTEFWDWSNGPIPPARLSEIERIQVTIVAPSGRPNTQGGYAETRLSTDVNSIRNVPNFGRKDYPVDGYVFDDLNRNGVMDVGEWGVWNASVRLGKFSTTTNWAGYFVIRAPAGNYWLKHIPPPGYASATNPDSIGITIGPAATAFFADTAKAGGWVTAYVFDDANQNGVYEWPEPALSNVQVTMQETGESRFTDPWGYTWMFAPEGTYNVRVTPPDSFTVIGPNPVTGTMVNFGWAFHQFPLARTEVGQIVGQVFRDNDRDGVLDAGEPGLPNVWVGASSDGGVTTSAYEYTDGSGNYSLTVPANNPPGTTPYMVMTILPSGYYATGTTAVSPVWVAPSATVSGVNFGMLGYQVITLNASRVLSLAAADLVEKQGADNGSTTARRDRDLVLGADAGGTDNISVWFNQYDNSPVFDPNPTYTRNAPQSVLSISLDTLDSNAPKARPDVVTGTRYNAAGNFFVWFNQNSGGNEGYFPLAFSQAYRTADNGDVQSVLTRDLAGGLLPDEVDILVGTKSPTAGQGSIELWQSDNAADPTYTRIERYPPDGAIPSDKLGEVTAMALADLDGDGDADLVAGTRLGDYDGQLVVFENRGRGLVGFSTFRHIATLDPGGAVTSLCATTVDFDGDIDIVVGVQRGFSAGQLQQWDNQSVPGLIDLKLEAKEDAAGLIMAIKAADFGGVSGHPDLAIGWRADETSFVGGVLILPLDAGQITNSFTDPSTGSITNMVPALAISNFNFGIRPATPLPPYLPDLAAGVKISPLTGALVVFIR